MLEQIEKPATDDREGWKEYWQQVQPQEWFKSWGYWRTEPEISVERQNELSHLRDFIAPDIENGIYPFGNVSLTRADIEWLLATHKSEGIVGPINWDEVGYQTRKGLDLRGADLKGKDLRNLPLALLRGGLSKGWRNAPIDQRDAARIHLEGSNLSEAHLEGAILNGAHLERSTIFKAHLESAWLGSAHLEMALFHDSFLDGAYLQGAYLDSSTNLTRINLGSKKYGTVSIVDVRWGEANISGNWNQVQMLGDEMEARRKKIKNIDDHDLETTIETFERAVRANRQLATILRAQGVNEEADRFAYRAQLCQRTLFRLQRKFGKYFWSELLNLVAGYGYRPQRSFIAYIFIILAFATTYFFLGQSSHPLSYPESIVVSMTAFHGRGFFANQFSPGDPQAYASAIEAFLGLLIEVSFIATFTQRYFGK